jgi:hypothetical protein
VLGLFSRPVEALRPVETFNPLLQRFYQALTARGLKPGAPLPELADVVKKYVGCTDRDVA